MTITKKEFESYEEVRESGKTNMFDVRMVEALSGLPREKIFEIMKTYGTLKAKYIGNLKKVV
jgi:hypothetical protein